MIRRAIAAAGLLLGTLAGQWALAQSQPDLEPGVQTSPTPHAEALHAPQPPPSAPAAPAATPPTVPAAASRGAAKPAPTTSAPATPAPGDKSARASQDRIQLDTTQISGNRELPKVMYVVPWRKADPGEFAGRPPNSLLDEALTPVDRDVFRRQNRYYSALEAGAGSSGAAAAPGASAAQAPDSRDEK